MEKDPANLSKLYFTEFAFVFGGQLFFDFKQRLS